MDMLEYSRYFHEYILKYSTYKNKWYSCSIACMHPNIYVKSVCTWISVGKLTGYFLQMWWSASAIVSAIANQNLLHVIVQFAGGPEQAFWCCCADGLYEEISGCSAGYCSKPFFKFKSSD